MNYFEDVRGVNVLQDWDNFFENKLLDYYTIREVLDGEWYTWEKAVVTCEDVDNSATLLPLINSTNLPRVLRTYKQEIVLICVVVGVGIKGNPYNLPDTRTIIVDIFDKTKNMYFTAQELAAFVTKISKNPYGTKFTAGPIIGLAKFDAVIAAVQEVQDPNDLDEIAIVLQDNLNTLLTQQPSTLNPAINKKGLIFTGLFGYTFHYE